MAASDDIYDLRPGERLAGRYLVERRLGDGGMGQVYVARDERFERPVALKLLHPHVAKTEEGRLRFEREARTLSLVVHPNVVTVHDYGSDDGRLFLVMEYVDGVTLDEVVRKRGRLPPDEAAVTVAQVAEGLAEIHAAGVVHRDIKPQNIVMRELAGGTMLAKVVDFGLARQEEGGGDVTAAGDLLGTPYYMAPEQIQGGLIDGRTDQYALAVVLFELLTGRRPFQRETVQSTLIAHLVDDIPALTHMSGAGLSTPLEAVVRRGLAKSSDDRYPAVIDFAQAVRAAGGGAPTISQGQICDGCGAKVADSARHCGQCGATMALPFCGTCGAEREGKRLHCGRCMTSLVPPSPQAALSPCTLVAAVLRLPLAEFGVDPVEVATRARTVIEREGGRVLALLGRELVAAFGVGGLRPGEVEAALDAGLALVGVAGCEDVAIGVDLGSAATVGTGSGWGATYLAGQAVEGARAAAGHAKGGQIVVAEAAYNDVRAVYVVHPVVSSFRAVERRKAVSFVDYVRRDGEPPHLGRDIELSQLQRAARRVQQRGKLAVVTITGPSGIGKSRLLAEFLGAVEDAGQVWHADVARCRRSHMAAPYEPFIEILSHRLRAHGGGLVQETISALRDLPGLGDPSRTIAAQDQRLNRVAGLLCAQSEANTLPPGQSFELEQREAYAGYASYVTGAAAARPVILALEDLQNASAATVELLCHILEACRDSPVLGIVTMDESSNDELVPALESAAGRIVGIDLMALEPSECSDLLRWALPPHVPPDDVVSAVATFSEGVPDQILEAADALRQSAAYTPNEQTWLCRDPSLAVATLEQSRDELTERLLERASVTAREVAMALAVAGGTAPRALVVEMLGREGVEQDIAELKRLRMLVERRAGSLLGERELALRTDRISVLLLAAAPQARVVGMHRSAAGWLTERRASVPGIAARVANHRLAAGEHQLAAVALAEAARDALRRMAGRDAFDLYEQAVQAARRGDPTVSTASEKRILVAALAGVAETGAHFGKPDAAIGAAREADLLLRHTPDPELHCRILAALGDALELTVRHPAALSAFERVQEIAAADVDLDPQAAHAMSRRAMILHHLGRPEDAAAVAHEALDRWRDDTRAPLQSPLGRLQTVLGHLARLGSRLDDADEHYSAALAHFNAAGDALGAAMVVLSRGNIAYQRGDMDVAERHYREAGERARAIGHTYGALTADTNLGNVLMDADRVAEAVDVLEGAAAMARKTRVLSAMPETLRLLAECRLRLGERDVALDTAKQAMIRAHSMGGKPAIDRVRETLNRVRQHRKSGS